MKINPSNPYIQIFNNFECEKWKDVIFKNNPNCVFHLIEIENKNPTSQEDIERMFRS